MTVQIHIKISIAIYNKKMYIFNYSFYFWAYTYMYYMIHIIIKYSYIAFSLCLPFSKPTYNIPHSGGKKFKGLWIEKKEIVLGNITLVPISKKQNMIYFKMFQGQLDLLNIKRKQVNSIFSNLFYLIKIYLYHVTSSTTPSQIHSLIIIVTYIMCVNI